MRILLASSNEHKRHEIQQLFEGHEILLPPDIGLSFDCDEDGETFIENALKKANALFDIVHENGLGLPVLADDSGLVVPALPGLLGVRTARFGSKDGKHLLSAHEKNMLLLEMLKDKKDRTAFFVCAMAMMKDRNTVYCAVENTKGRILDKETGAGGFGYDPVFYCDEANEAMALLSEEMKNEYSHRGKAARSLLKLI